MSLVFAQIDQKKLVCFVLVSSVGHVIILLRTASFKFRLIPVHMNG